MRIKSKELPNIEFKKSRVLHGFFCVFLKNAKENYEFTKSNN